MQYLFHLPTAILVSIVGLIIFILDLNRRRGLTKKLKETQQVNELLKVELDFREQSILQLRKKLAVCYMNSYGKPAEESNTEMGWTEEE